MTPISSSPARLGVAALMLVVLAAAGGYGLASLTRPPAAPQAPASGGRVLYWYDPMVPNQHFDHPGLSPMGMQMVPRYANGGGDGEPGVRIDPNAAQNFGVRTAVATMGTLGSSLTVTGAIGFNQRDIAIVQPRANGFVQKVYGRAPGDVIGAGAPIVDLLIPDWGGAQAEFLALVRDGDPVLIAAGRRRLALMGMPQALIARVERTGRVASVVTVTSPIGGAIQKLDVRPGMSVGAGQELAVVNGLGTVWLTAEVPQAQAAQVRPGQGVTATLAAYPGETFRGRVTEIVPQAQADSNTIQVRIELPNREGKLHPGLYARVAFASTATPALLVPSEAVIETGRRDLVMLALPGGHYEPAEVRIGRQADGQTEIIAGLAEGERVVASGEFLLDSEASLEGMRARPISAPVAPPGRPPVAPRASAAGAR